MNKIAKIIIVLGIICIGIVSYFIFTKNPSTQSVQNITTTPITPTTQSNPTPTVSQTTTGSVYQNQYIKVTVPTGWTLTEATRTTQNQTYDKTTGKTTLLGAPVIQKTGAVNITKGNYVLYISPRTDHASGIQSGRFSEIASGATSADAVTTPGNGSCGTSNPTTINTNGTTAQRVDYYVGTSDKTEFCNVPINGQSVWYFSYITTDSNGYFNVYNIPNMSNVAWVVTMAYNSKNINSLPVKGSADLNQALVDMSNILKTLTINAPVPYVPTISQKISAMSNTYWTQAATEGVDSPVESCTDTSFTNNISQTGVKASYHMEAENSDRKTLFTSSDTQTRLATVEGILTNNGWTKCNTLNKQSPAGSSLQTTDAIDVYQNGKDFVDVDSSFAKNPSIGIPLHNIFLTFFTLK